MHTRRQKEVFGQFPAPAVYATGKKASGILCLKGLAEPRPRLDALKKERHLLSVSGIEPSFLGCSARRLVTILTGPSWAI